MKKYLSTLTLVVLLAVILSPQVFATTQISVELNGIPLIFASDSTPRIVMGRTLVPIRAIAEALGGEVSYDEPSKTARIVGEGVEIRFPIGQQVMYVNDDKIPLDTGAQAFAGRSFVPARPLAEALGNEVSWDEARKTVVIQTPRLERRLVANYYTSESADQFRQFGQRIHEVHIRWADITIMDGKSKFRQKLPPGYRSLIDTWAVGMNNDLSLQVFCDDPEILHSLLASGYEHQITVIDDMISLTKALQFTGLNLDFEGLLDSSQRESLSKFFALAGEMTREHDLVLSAYLPAKRRATDYQAYDYHAISTACDYVVVMAHDLVRPSHSPGPAAPLWWVEEVLRFALSQGNIPREKLLLATSLHGLNWPKNTTSRAMEQPIIYYHEAWLKERGLKIIPLDPIHGMGYLEYLSPLDGERILWTETTESIALKVGLLEKYNIRGMSIWRLGAIPPGFFEDGGPLSAFK